MTGRLEQFDGRLAFVMDHAFTGNLDLVSVVLICLFFVPLFFILVYIQTNPPPRPPLNLWQWRAPFFSTVCLIVSINSRRCRYIATDGFLVMFGIQLERRFVSIFIDLILAVDLGRCFGSQSKLKGQISRESF